MCICSSSFAIDSTNIRVLLSLLFLLSVFITLRRKLIKLDIDALLDNWYLKHKDAGVVPHPALMEHDRLHALLYEPPTWEGEIKVGVLDYVYNSLVRGISLTEVGAREFLQTVVGTQGEGAYDFLTNEELRGRISASVKILRKIGLENI